jgi:hypothetical protein
MCVIAVAFSLKRRLLSVRVNHSARLKFAISLTSGKNRKYFFNFLMYLKKRFTCQIVTEKIIAVAYQIPKKPDQGLAEGVACILPAERLNDKHERFPFSRICVFA